MRAAAPAALIGAVIYGAPASAELISTTTQNPLLASVQLPAPLPAALDDTTTSAVLNWSSNALVQVRGDDALVIDSEVKELRLAMVHAVTDCFAIKVEGAYYEQRAGGLDSFIDDFHEWTSLPEGDRPLLSRDELMLFYRDDGRTYVDSDAPSSGIGDIGVSAGWQLSDSERRQSALWLTLNLATSTEDLYTLPDNATEASLTYSLQQQLGARWQFFAQGSATTHIGADFINDQADVIWSGHVGVEFAFTRHVGLVAQLQGHTALVPDSKLEILGGSVVATLGGSIVTDDGWRFELGLSEDVAVEASPDVVFVFGVSKRHE